MRLTLAEPRYLKDSISIISDLVNEATFKITPDAVELVAMDHANVAMVIFKLLSTTFSEYSVKGPTELAINLTNLKMILKRAKPNDVLTLELGQDNKLTILLKGTTTRTFSLPIIELEDKEQRVPELTFTSIIKTNASIFNEAIEDAEIVAESVMFQTMVDKFIVSAEGDMSKAKVEIDKSNETNITLKADNVKSKYSIEYIKKMMVASKLADTVEINFSKDYPLRLDYKVMDKLLLSFILAPRVEND